MMVKCFMPKKIQNDLPDILLIDNKTIGERIAEVRKKKNLTQVKLANKLGIMRSTLSDYELGRSRIYDEMITRIALALEVTSDRILGIKKDETFYNNYTNRIEALEKLPDYKKRIVLKELDASIKSNES